MLREYRAPRYGSEASARREGFGSGFFQRRLAANRKSRPQEQRIWQADIYEYIRGVVSLQGSLGIERMCHLAGVSRAGFYRHLRASDNHEEEMHVQSEIQRIALEHRGQYGYRRMTAELRKQGMLVNHEKAAISAGSVGISGVIELGC
jgi:putative transposase